MGLIKAVARLALPADGQLAYLRDLGVSPSIDELALELHDGVVLLPQFVANGWLAVVEATAIEALDESLLRLGEQNDGAWWTEAALVEAPEWEEVRIRARVVLAL